MNFKKSHASKKHKFIALWSLWPRSNINYLGWLSHTASSTHTITWNMIRSIFIIPFYAYRCLPAYISVPASVKTCPRRPEEGIRCPELASQMVVSSLAALPDNLSLIPSTYIEQFTNTCDSSSYSRALTPSSGLYVYPHKCDTHKWNKFWKSNLYKHRAYVKEESGSQD